MRLVIDTDAGIDDAQAIMMALAHSNATVEAITAVTGNVHLDQVVPNVCTVLDLFDADIPVYPGAYRPLVASWKPAGAHIHGEDGLGDWPGRKPSARKPECTAAAAALVELANRYPGELTLVALGPMTNIALATRLDPTFPQKIRQLTFMGGAIAARGNTENVTAEFNIYCDPEAAFIVLDAFSNIRMVSWETTLAHPLPWSIYDDLLATTTDRSTFCAGIGATLVRLLRDGAEQYDGFLIPDPLAMAITLEPGLIRESETRYVMVELHGSLTRGQTVIDYGKATGKLPNVEIVTRIDMEGVYDLYRQMLC